MISATVLPHVNAILNAVSTVLLVIAFVLIRRGNRLGHRAVMIAALSVSAVFLACYLVYHFTAPVFVFTGEGWVRPIYYVMLVSHVVLAVVATPMIAFTAWRGIKAWGRSGAGSRIGSGPGAAGDFSRHRAIARWTFPIWLYVTVTGVLIYLMLYHLYPAVPA